MKFTFPSISILCLLMISFQGMGQSLPLGTVALEEYYRRQQIMGNLDSTISFAVRPLSFSALRTQNAFKPDSLEMTESENSIQNLWKTKNEKGRALLLPVSMQVQLNSAHPYGLNDGPMIPARGLQTLISGGIFAEYGPISVQLKPELVWASNGGFETFNEDHYPIIYARYYDFYNQIDLPARFGTSAYAKLFLGQSSIRLNHKKLSAGFSTENLWWGPGRKSSLLMSNNAPGFLHATLNTVEPIHSPIGSFEGQIVGGQLLASGFGVLEPELEYLDNPLYVPKRKSSRYFTGFVLSWQPKWVPGLFLGMTKSEQLYRSDLHKFGDLLPFHKASPEVTTADSPISTRDVKSSYFMRWVWKEEQAELYFEYGHDKSNNDSREALLTPERSRAYVVGLRKVFPFNASRGENFIVNLEVTQMQKTFIQDIRKAQSWYIDPYIRHGYTHRGQVLGSGVGPGGNMQSIEVSWFKGLKRLGFQVERLVHNNDFYLYAYEDSKDFRRHWTDLSFAAIGEWNYQNLVLNAKLQGINSLNYQWYLLQEPGDSYMVNGDDAFNLQFQAGVTYRF